MSGELNAVLEYLEHERGIDRDTLLGLVEESLMVAARRSLRGSEELRVKIDRMTGTIGAWDKMTVRNSVVDPDREVDLEEARKKFSDAEVGDVIDWEVTPKDFGRIAAQIAKQTIMQRLRQAEKRMACDEFEDLLTHLITGVVRRIDRGDVIVDFSRAEGVMPHNQRIPGEDYQPGDHITALLIEVNANRPGHSLVVSRSHPDFVRRLFEREVSEMSDGLVSIRAVAREAGYRSKIAVDTTDSRIDPVGACVGLRGSRVKTVVREISGEKVDIIRWNSDVREFVGNALQPAKLDSIIVDEAKHSVSITVPESQLSLAIGKKGQNARLAAKLTGWRIDINRVKQPVEADFNNKVRHAVEVLANIPGIGEDTAEILVKNGFLSLEGIIAADINDIALIEELGIDRANDIMAAAKKHLGY